MGSEIRIGVVGLGAMGKAHVDVWQNVAQARVTAVCDTNGDRAAEIAGKIGAAPFANYAEMIDSGLIDAVDICTWSGLHCDQGLLAASRSLHVLCEKPLDLSLDKVDRLIEACQSRNLTLACIFQRRSYTAAQRVAEVIHDGQFGPLVSASAYVKWHRPQSYYDSSAWRGTWKYDGGVLANQAVHAIDHVCWLAGRVVEVEYANLWTVHKMDAEDNAIAVVRYESGARGVIEATTCCLPDLCSRVEVFGETGAVTFDDAIVTKFGVKGKDLLETFEQPQDKIGGGSAPMEISFKGHEAQMADFVDAIINSRKPMVSGEDARMSVEALNLIYHRAFPGIKLGT